MATRLLLVAYCLWVSVASAAQRYEKHAKSCFDELAFRLKAFDSFDSLPEHIRSVLLECIAGRGFEFTHKRSCAALGASEGLIEVRIAGSLEGALATIRAMQGDKVVFHEDPPKNQ